MTPSKAWRKKASRAPYAGYSRWYAGTRARVEARAPLEQAEELWRALEEIREGRGSPQELAWMYALLPNSCRAVIRL